MPKNIKFTAVVLFIEAISPSFIDGGIVVVTVIKAVIKKKKKEPVQICTGFWGLYL
ncbi:MAG: hypothetical protein GY754_14610 [bacterium]|nr:hypothetical protein [bacterium]